MNEPIPYSAILNSLFDRIVFVDTDQFIRFMNQAAIEHHEEGAALLGTSIFDCHDDRSNEVIRDTFAAMLAGLQERKITDNDEMRIFMRAVRAEDGTLLGYYERYEQKQR